MKKEITTTCEYCGCSYSLPAAEYNRKVKRGAKFFCCFEHYRLSRIKTNKNKICPVCGKEFFSKWNTTYCSHACANTVVNKSKISKYRNNTKKECLNCHTEFKPSWSGSKFCSKNCEITYKNKESIRRVEETGEFSKRGHEVNRAQAVRYFTEKTGYKCSICGISDWNGKPLTLVVDHIDGNSSNNKVENVRLLCPNCDSQTITYKKIGKSIRAQELTESNITTREKKRIDSTSCPWTKRKRPSRGVRRFIRAMLAEPGGTGRRARSGDPGASPGGQAILRV